MVYNIHNFVRMRKLGKVCSIGGVLFICDYGSKTMKTSTLFKNGRIEEPFENIRAKRI